ncbi:MAG: FxsA family protein [Pirellulales bacterium]|nr:FxsA family protein [Pirellulales bacterium]
MLRRIGLLLLVYVAAEMATLIVLGRRLGVLPTILLVLGGGVVGMWIARQQGLRAALKAQDRMAQGVVPSKEMSDGLLITLAAVLFILPGVLTDVLGLALLFPPTRAVLRHAVVSHFTRNSTLGRMGFGRQHPPRPPGGARVIDARVIETRVIDD